MLYLLGFSVLFLLLGFSVYYIYSRKKIALMKYWGYSKASIIWKINKDIIRFWIFNEMIWLMIWIGVGWKFEGNTKNNRIYVYMYFGKFIDKYYNFSVGNYNKLYDIIF